jgi:hypothetical protein
VLLLQVVAAFLLVLGSALIIGAVIAADTPRRRLRPALRGRRGPAAVEEERRAA